MKKQILVALQSENPLAQIIPYLETAIEPDTRVILLIPYGMAGRRLGAHVDNPETWAGARETMSAGKPRVGDVSSQDEQKRMAELRLALTEQAMRKKGVDIVTDIYRGRLRTVISRYVRSSDVRLIIRRKKFGVVFSTLLHNAIRLLGHLKNPDFSTWHCSLRGTGYRS